MGSETESKMDNLVQSIGELAGGGQVLVCVCLRESAANTISAGGCGRAGRNRGKRGCPENACVRVWILKIKDLTPYRFCYKVEMSWMSPGFSIGLDELYKVICDDLWHQVFVKVKRFTHERTREI
jgi:hypothetical protein